MAGENKNWFISSTYNGGLLRNEDKLKGILRGIRGRGGCKCGINNKNAKNGTVYSIMSFYVHGS